MSLPLPWHHEGTEDFPKSFVKKVIFLLLFVRKHKQRFLQKDKRVTSKVLQSATEQQPPAKACHTAVKEYRRNHSGQSCKSNTRWGSKRAACGLGKMTSITVFGRRRKWMQSQQWIITRPSRESQTLHKYLFISLEYVRCYENAQKVKLEYWNGWNQNYANIFILSVVLSFFFNFCRNFLLLFEDIFTFFSTFVPLVFFQTPEFARLS